MSDAIVGKTTLDRDGNLLGVVKESMGENYVEIERERNNWFIPREWFQIGPDENLCLPFDRALAAGLDLQVTADRRPG